jgi:N-methylhydantoinase A/oxoprolinase/acetone carboxylase beta subunit
MPSKLASCVIGIDVGGTNTDAVMLQNEAVLAWHKTPTTTDIQTGVERAIEEVVKKAAIPSDHVDSVKIGTTVRTSFHCCRIFDLLSSLVV